MRIGLVIILLAGLLLGPGQAAADAPIVAVFDIEAKDISLPAKTLAKLRDYLEARLAAKGAFQLVPREEIRKRLMLKKKGSYKLCYDSACQIELGRELAAQKSLATRILKIDSDTCVVTTILFDLKKATSEQAATAEGGCSPKTLMTSISTVATKLTAASKKSPSSGVSLIETSAKVKRLPIDFDPKQFDALGFLARATKLAAERMDDALLVDFDVQGVLPDGQVNLTLNPEYRANYRFRSPSRSTGDPSLPANVEQEIECLVYVEVSAKQIEIYNVTSIENCKEKPRPPWSCTLSEAFGLARKAGAPAGNLVAKVSWLWDGWYFDFGKTSFSVKDSCR
jgi:hypothetical protein